MEESPVARLRRRIGSLGRHYERYLLEVEKHYDQLLARLESESVLEDVELWSMAHAPGVQMRLMSAIGRTQQEKQDFLATYYSLQFLHMNLLAVDRLELGLSDAQHKAEGYRRFLSTQASHYQRLNASYIECLLNLFMDGHPLPEYCICEVGTPWDQDDVDVVVLREGPPNSDFNKALGRVCNEFFKRAGRLHLYIAENIGLSGYSGTVDEYEDLLNKNITDFVMISELLSAQPLVGSHSLFEKFSKRIISRFYSGRQRWRKYHEAFLRSLLGELHAQIGHDVRRDRMDFKRDALRIIKGMAQAGRVVFGISLANPLDVLDELASRSPELGEAYETLSESLLFIEVFRLLYQVLVVQEEEVDINEESETLVELIAEVMGYEEKGGVSAGAHLVVQYFQAVERARFTCRKSLPLLAEYLRKVSGYSYLELESGGRKTNLAREIADSVRMFRGHIFFEDVLDALGANQGQLANKLVEDTFALRRRDRDSIIAALLTFARSDPVILIELMLLIVSCTHKDSRRLFELLLEGLFARLRNEDGLMPGLLSVYNSRPEVMNRFIEALTRPQRQSFEMFLQCNLYENGHKEALNRLKKYIWLRTAGSEFYRRIFRKVVSRNPQFIHHLLDVDRLMTYASGFLAFADSTDDREQLQGLADYYDVAYLACAIRALTGEPLDNYRIPFTEFVHTYLNLLYQHAKQNALIRHPECGSVHGDVFAMLATGGYARGQAFDDDYDLVLIVNTDSDDVLQFYQYMATSLHRELVKRGTIPQYRFADHFGGFVCKYSQIREFFLSGQAETVDRTQILGSKLVLGSSRFMKMVYQDIIGPLFFDRAAEVTAELVGEMRHRHSSFETSSPRGIDLKESPGGLRDLEVILLLLKVKYRLAMPISTGLLDQIEALDPANRDVLNELRWRRDELRRVRDLYRLLVAAQDEVQEDELGLVGSVMGWCQGDAATTSSVAFGKVLDHMRHVRRLTGILIDSLPR